MHEHVGEEAPGARAVPWVVDQGALHVLGVVGLQHPLVQPGPIAEEHDDLHQSPQPTSDILLRPPPLSFLCPGVTHALCPGSEPYLVTQDITTSITHLFHARSEPPMCTDTSQLGSPIPSTFGLILPWPSRHYSWGHPSPLLQI